MATPYEQFRTKMERALRQLMGEALDADWTDEANICLDALCLLARGPTPDYDAPVTPEERMAITGNP